jgi:hypothetical protein
MSNDMLASLRASQQIESETRHLAGQVAELEFMVAKLRGQMFVVQFAAFAFAIVAALALLIVAFR